MSEYNPMYSSVAPEDVKVLTGKIAEILGCEYTDITLLEYIFVKNNGIEMFHINLIKRTFHFYTNVRVIHGITFTLRELSGKVPELDRVVFKETMQALYDATEDYILNWM